ncbi:MAG TPA: DedA family protein [Thermoleophilaceae bacterium]|jgi:membrane protein DedA with SNARE-associated domain|nr:DedA family protein [Thermoleophilaceae bacterium]
MLVLASVSDRLVDFAVRVIGDLGLFGVYVLTVLESACIPIPSEATMMFAGFNVSDGKFPLWAAVVVAVLGELTGALIAYGVGYFGRVDLIEKHGKRLHVSPAKLQTADRWFARHGEATVFFGRMIPVVRAFVSLPAGVARMPLRRFIPFTVLGSAPWLLAWALAGRAAGDNWRHYRHYVGYLDYAVLAAAIAGIVYLVLRRRNRRADVETVT